MEFYILNVINTNYILNVPATILREQLLPIHRATCRAQNVQLLLDGSIHPIHWSIWIKEACYEWMNRCSVIQRTGQWIGCGSLHGATIPTFRRRSPVARGQPARGGRPTEFMASTATGACNGGERHHDLRAQPQSRLGPAYCSSVFLFCVGARGYAPLQAPSLSVVQEVSKEEMYPGSGVHVTTSGIISNLEFSFITTAGSFWSHLLPRSGSRWRHVTTTIQAVKVCCVGRWADGGQLRGPP